MNNTVLVITAASEDAERLRQGLAAARDGPFDITWVTTLSEGLTRLRESPIDIILADLLLPDSQGIATFDKLFLAAPGIPIMTLASEDDEFVAKEAVQRGGRVICQRATFRTAWCLRRLAASFTARPSRMRYSSKKSAAGLFSPPSARR